MRKKAGKRDFRRKIEIMRAIMKDEYIVPFVERSGK
jgi:hypothetical protein